MARLTKVYKDVAGRTWTRRSLLQWLGKGAVVTLAGLKLPSCLLDTGHPLDGGWMERDGSGGDGGPDPGVFPFQPGAATHPVYRGWGERTVDQQDIERILSTWRLRVDGMVSSPRDLSFGDLISLPRTDQVTDFHCVEGWSVYDVPWNGVQLARLIDPARPKPEATHLTFHTVEGVYNESLPLEQVLEPRTLLAYGIGGATLPLAHGFPLRLVVPRLLGYKNAKYVERLELTDHPVEGFWVQAGYPYDGEVSPGRLRPGRY